MISACPTPTPFSPTSSRDWIRCSGACRPSSKRSGWTWSPGPRARRARRARAGKQRARRPSAGSVDDLSSKELLRVVATLERHLLGDATRLDVCGERHVHRLHAERRAGLHHRVDLVRLALADQVAHGRRADQDLHGHGSRPPVGGLEQLLGHDALERPGGCPQGGLVADNGFRVAAMGNVEAPLQVHPVEPVVAGLVQEDEPRGGGDPRGVLDDLHALSGAGRKDGEYHHV